MYFNGLDVAVSGMKAQRVRMDLISSNLANVNSTSGGDNGGPYRRKLPVFETILDQQMGKGLPLSKVAVKEIIKDNAPFKVKYDPANPDADADGNVQMPNIDPMRETVDMISAMRSYEANLTAFNTHKEMLVKSLEILRV